MSAALCLEAIHSVTAASFAGYAGMNPGDQATALLSAHRDISQITKEQGAMIITGRMLGPRGIVGPTLLLLKPNCEVGIGVVPVDDFPLHIGFYTQSGSRLTSSSLPGRMTFVSPGLISDAADHSHPHLRAEQDHPLRSPDARIPYSVLLQMRVSQDLLVSSASVFGASMIDSDLPPPFNIVLESLPFSPDTKLKLRASELETVADLVKLRPLVLIQSGVFSHSNVSEIREIVHSVGHRYGVDVHLGMEVPECL